MNCSDIEARSNCEAVYIHGAIVSVLAKFLDLSVPWVWILGHRPNKYVQWWNSTVPLNINGAVFTGSVRDICLDLQLPTDDFISRAKEFDEHGIDLIQSHHQMPNTLCLDQVPEPQQDKILVQNGATLRVHLPHSIETAMVQSFRNGYLSTIIEA